MAQMRRGGQSVQSKLGFLIYGDMGTWKSSLAAELGKMVNEKGEPMKVLYLDTENGSIDDLLNAWEEEGTDTSNIVILNTVSLEEVKNFIKQATNANAKNPIINEYIDEEGKNVKEQILNADGSVFIPDAIVIDSMSVLHDVVQQSTIQMSEKRAAIKAQNNGVVGAAKAVAVETAGIEIKDYQKIDHRGKEILLDLMASGKHFVVTSREKKVTKSEKINGQIQMIDTGEVVAKGFKEMGYNVKTVLHTFINEDGVVCAQIINKDRTRVHHQNEIIECPSLLDWQKVINKNVDREEFIIKNTIQEAIEKDKELQVKELVKSVGEDSLNEKDFTLTEEAIKSLDALKVEMKDIITKIRNQDKDKTLMTKLSKLYTDNGIKEKNPDNYKDVESLQKVKDIVLAWAKENKVVLD